MGTMGPKSATIMPKIADIGIFGTYAHDHVPHF